MRAKDSFSEHFSACCAMPSYFQLVQVCISCSIFYTKRICAECAPQLVEQVADFSWGSYYPDVFTLVSLSLIESVVLLFSGRAAFRAHGCCQTARSEGCFLTPLYTHVRHHRLHLRELPRGSAETKSLDSTNPLEFASVVAFGEFFCFPSPGHNLSSYLAIIFFITM